MLMELEGNLEKARGLKDVDLENHLALLDKKHLKTTGWTTTPLENVEHDFVTPLLTAYLSDLQERKF